MTKPLFKPLSQSLFESINQAYKAGNYGLLILTTGIISILIAYFLPRTNALSYIILALGLAMILLPAAVLYKELGYIVSIRKSIKQHQEFIDTLQKTALELIKLVSSLESLASDNTNHITNLLAQLKTQIQNIPIISSWAENDIFKQTNQLSGNIINYTTRIRTIIGGIENALTTANFNDLKKYLAELNQLQAEINLTVENS